MPKALVVQSDFAGGRAVSGDWPIPGAQGNPRLAALLTPRDTRTYRIVVGMRVALSAESADLVGYVNQPTEAPGPRTRLAWLLGPDSPNSRFHQLVMRFGQCHRHIGRQDTLLKITVAPGTALPSRCDPRPPIVSTSGSERQPS